MLSFCSRLYQHNQRHDKLEDLDSFTFLSRRGIWVARQLSRERTHPVGTRRFFARPLTIFFPQLRGRESRAQKAGRVNDRGLAAPSSTRMKT